MSRDEMDALLYALQGLALARNLPIPRRLEGLEVFLPFLDDVRQEKALFLLRFIPQPNDKNDPTYVVSIGGGPMPPGTGAIVFKDSVMENALARALLEYARRYWGFEW